MYCPFPRNRNLTDRKVFHSFALMVPTEYTRASVLYDYAAVFHKAYLLHGSTENTVALVIRDLDRAQKLNAESLDPRWVSFHAYWM